MSVKCVAVRMPFVVRSFDGVFSLKRVVKRTHEMLGHNRGGISMSCCFEVSAEYTSCSARSQGKRFSVSDRASVRSIFGLEGC